MKSKGKKKGYIGIAITAILLIVTVVADLLVSRYITMIKLYFRDDSNSVYEMSADEALSQAADLTEELGNEGIVLLKNKDNASLPLAAGTKINLFGIASYQTLYRVLVCIELVQAGSEHKYEKRSGRCRIRSKPWTVAVL